MSTVTLQEPCARITDKKGSRVAILPAGTSLWGNTPELHTRASHKHTEVSQTAFIHSHRLWVAWVPGLPRTARYSRRGAKPGRCPPRLGCPAAKSSPTAVNR